MKILLYTIIGIFLGIGLLFVVLSVSSRKQPELGLVNGQLQLCPATQNCVCSELQVEGAFVEPLNYFIAVDKHIIHIRSASRVGHSELGANRKRVIRIRTEWGKMIGLYRVIL